MPTPPRPADEGDAGLFERLIPAVIEAGKAILRIRGEGHGVDMKADRSPVTEADRVAERIIVAALRKIAPSLPIVAEEEVAAGNIPEVGDVFFLVDALDGTRDFVGGGNDFTVNVGLVRGGAAVAGIVHAPATGSLALGVVGAGASLLPATGKGERRPIAVRAPSPRSLDIVASRSHRTPETDAFIDRFPGSRIVAAGSSLKFVVIAEGKADLYPRLGRTSQWDTAAGDAVLTAAGGRVLEITGQRLTYGPRLGGRHPFPNPWFVATGGLDPFARAAA